MRLKCPMLPTPWAGYIFVYGPVAGSASHHFGILYTKLKRLRLQSQLRRVLRTPLLGSLCI